MSDETSNTKSTTESQTLDCIDAYVTSVENRLRRVVPTLPSELRAISAMHEEIQRLRDNATKKEG
jgi:hypothetical protein